MNRALVFPFSLLLAWPACAADLLLLPVQSAVTEPDPMDASKSQVHVHLTDEGRARFSKFTTEHVGETLEILANAKAISPPIRILTPIGTGEVILNSVPPTKAEQVAREISSNPEAFGVELLP